MNPWRGQFLLRLRNKTVRNNPIRFLRKIAAVEGISFLVLLGIAMPLKYALGYPQAVKLVGWLHGILFVILCASLAQTMIVARWPFTRGAIVFVAALLPFGPFILDRRMDAYEQEFERGRQL